MNKVDNKYDVIVVGGGHAGVEASLASARLGMKTLLITLYLNNISLMSCNPAIGGSGKSHLVSELGMLGGEMAKHIDNYNLQLKHLNHTKGFASKITRGQADKYWYRIKMRDIVENQDNLEVLQGEIIDLILSAGVKLESGSSKKAIGVIHNLGTEIYSDAVILCTGTFLSGKYVVGNVKYSSGRQGEPSSDLLPKKLKEYGIDLDVYQTATPPRIDKKTIDFLKVEKLFGEDHPSYFSFETTKEKNQNIPTYLTFTTEKTIEIGKELLQYSPIVTGIVTSKGPRHCPSLDRKIMNFPEKTKHQIFLEQESVESNEMYVNGFTTALPPFAQEELIRTITGLENVKIMRYGYAIEYEYIPAKQMKKTLENRIIEGLFTAGTINGTSGYEEAACQGFLAGVNAARKIKNQEPIIIDRSEGYIGVLIDDIVNKETPEPYRVLPSRAEYRLTLRQDNTFLRLLNKSEKIGIVSTKKLDELKKIKKEIEDEVDRLSDIIIYPTKEINQILFDLGHDKMINYVSALDFLARKEMSYDLLTNFIEINNDLSPRAKEQVEIYAKYKIYIDREKAQMDRFKKLENMKIPNDIDYEIVNGLSNIAVSSLLYFKPNTIGDATRISGVTSNDIILLMSHIENRKTF